MRSFIRLFAVACCTIAVFIAGPAHAEKRLALSVGVDVYDNLPAIEQLQKAVNDARAVGAALRQLGFDTAIEENVARLAFTRAWQRFLNRLEPGDTAALFFAGHGVEIGGLNYLLPRDVPRVVVGEDRVLAEASIRFNTLMDDLREKKVRVALFIVDACRDNPFRDGSGRSVGGTRGLARIEAAEGSFVMYSAGAGEQALDRLPGADTSPNSVYTRTLLPILASPGLSLQDIAIRVRRQVVEAARTAGRKQTPAYYDQIVGDLVLKAGAAAEAKPAAVPAPQVSDLERDWAAVRDTSSVAMLEAFIARHKVTFQASLAEARIAELKRLAEANKVAVVTPPPPEVVEPATGGAPDAALTLGRVFRDCAECPEMVVVPAGSFSMGSPENEVGRYGDEGPQHLVTIARPFAVGRFEVTFTEWNACVAAGGCSHRPNDEGGGGGNRPVINVSWNDITKGYLPWLSRKTGKAYRLLTEAEWEYAARAGTTGRWSFDGDETRLCVYANHADRTASYTWSNTRCSDGVGGAAEVGRYRPNAFGLHDMHGNAWEWVQDCWNDTYNGAPLDGSAHTAGDCSFRVLRGGSWGSLPRDLRSAHRNRNTPAHRVNGLGFRVGRAL
jgi:formylglycine-generating enzyme required for sulfatase activity